ncbi:MAG: hypothetical protein KF788_04340 [Piscinibacter sp.]|nr:hypothetical protein [Piscinibacter sp.]
MMLASTRSLARACTVALTLLAGAGAQAADTPASGGACRSDSRSLCSGVQPGGGRVIACLKSHESELSEACRAALPVMERCAGEVQSLCGSAGGPRALRSCLRENAGKLSPECRASGARR